MTKPGQHCERNRLWKQADGAPVSCLEKLKVLNENYEELRQSAQDALDDAILMGCSEAQLREALHQMVDELVSTYREQSRR